MDVLRLLEDEHDEAKALFKKLEKDGEQLAQDIRDQLLWLEAEFEEKTEYGDVYSITGSLIGPNGREIRVMSIWMVESVTNETKFITLYPKKED